MGPPLGPLVLLRKFCHPFPGVTGAVESEPASLQFGGSCRFRPFMWFLWPEVGLPLLRCASLTLHLLLCLAQKEKPLKAPETYEDRVGSELCRPGSAWAQAPGSGAAVWHLCTHPCSLGSDPALPTVTSHFQCEHFTQVEIFWEGGWTFPSLPLAPHCE